MRSLNSRALSSSLMILVSVFFLSATHLVSAASAEAKDHNAHDDTNSYLSFSNLLLSLPSPTLLRSHLYNLTRRSHVSGTPGDYYDANYVLRNLNSLPGFKAHIENVNVMLTYPAARPHLVAPSIKYTAKLSEDIVQEDDTNDSWWRNHTFNAYSPSGNVTAQLVYANYGRPQDFDVLASLGISVKNKIVIMRYGECFRGLKVMNAESRGAIGSIIYSDPIDDGYSKGKVYPKGPWRPPSGVQRGSAQFNSRCAGDPWRLYATAGTNKTVEDICGYPTKDLIPSKPVLPLSYEDAAPLLAKLGGPSAPPEAKFQGGLDFPYTVGPSSFDITLVTNNSFAPGKIPNIIATMHGSDRSAGSIILGNHRDAWVFGAVDPNSGTTALLEVGRCLSILYDKGWRPRRTIVLASWSGEEYGLLGSTAFAEMHEKDAVVRNSVAYLNVDIAVSGNKELTASATHSLDKLFFDAAAVVPAPDDPTKTLLDRWQGGEMGTLGSGSDYTAFLDRYGIASLDMTFAGDYGVYHSVYDSFHWMVTEADPNFEIHRSMTRLWLQMAYKLSSLPILPFHMTGQAKILLKQANELSATAAAAGVDLTPLIASAIKFLVAAETIDHVASQQDQNDGAQTRSINRRLAYAERRFLGPGLPKRPWFKHLLQAPGYYLGYKSRAFPGIAEALEEGDLDAARKEIHIAADAVVTAADFLSEAAVSIGDDGPRVSN